MRRPRNCANIEYILFYLVSSSISRINTASAMTANVGFHNNDPSGIFPAFVQHPVDHHSTPTVVSNIDSTEVQRLQKLQQRQQQQNHQLGQWQQSNNESISTNHYVISQLMETQEGLVRTADNIALAMQNLTGSMMELSTSVQNSMAIIAASMQEMSGTITNLTVEMINVKQTIEDNSPNKGEPRNHQQMEQLSREDCPGVWERVGTSCLRIISRPNKTWDEARSYCQHLGGDLAAPSGLQTLRQRLKGEIENFLWLGAHDRIEDGDWRWLISGNPVEAESWAPGEPNRGNTHNCACLARRDNYKFHDCLCNYKMGFICEIVQPETWASLS